MKTFYQIHTKNKALNENIILGKTYRFTILTSRLIRMEYREDGRFVDLPTQSVWNRDFPKADFIVEETTDCLKITTKDLMVQYDKKPFSKEGLTIHVLHNPYTTNPVWYYGEKTSNLKGTARTLDGIDGEVELEDGILSKEGFTIFDDSASLGIKEDGFVVPNDGKGKDLYFFGYGRDYKGCLQDFYYLTGKTPMIPKYALGNWWSRYYAYTQEEYLQLMERFAKEEIPFSVAVIDMDWHLVQIDPKYGSGWTGYTWNKQLFPEPKEFLEELHRRGMHVTLNVHPAEGIRGYEEYYKEMATAMEVNVEEEEPVVFDISNETFIENYFSCIHHPREEEGVDFWWVDWQQGNQSRVKGLDPLWMLNHYHYLDNQRDGKRPMIFSRYAGIGSHRYPIGFSGDTIITWESLAFQPYFTVTASNAGYGWWSHDIGGHMLGYRDDELSTRWVQFGVFSPIMRLHSSCNTFSGKEPWKYGKEAEETMKKYLRLRHQMIPYLYTMNRRASIEALPMIEPMYYEYPEEERAYQVPNEYFFGTELIVQPIVTKEEKDLKLASTTVWLPKGRWYDFFTGMRYEGDRMIKVYRPLDEMPVFAKAGAIIPMTGEQVLSGHCENPKQLELRVFVGADNTFTLYEDDGITMDYQKGNYAETTYTLQWREKRFTMEPAVGDQSCIPAIRDYTIHFYGVTEDALEKVTASVGEIGWTREYQKDKKQLTLFIEGVPLTCQLEVQFKETCDEIQNEIGKRAYEILNRAQIPFHIKEELYHLIQSQKPVTQKVSEMLALEISSELVEAMGELLLA